MISKDKFKDLAEVAIASTDGVLKVTEYSVHGYLVEMFYETGVDNKPKKAVLDFSNQGVVDGKYTYNSEEEPDGKGPWIVGNEISLMIRKEG